MVSAIISVLFGVLSIVTRAPIVLPVFGLAFGANAILKETKKTDNKRKGIIIIASIGIILNGLVAVSFILLSFLKK